jgi:hypothetical protein
MSMMVLTIDRSSSNRPLTLLCTRRGGDGECDAANGVAFDSLSDGELT